MKTRAGESRRAGSYATVVIGSALAAVAATSLAGQNYTLDDWMTVSSVGSYRVPGSVHVRRVQVPLDLG